MEDRRLKIALATFNLPSSIFYLRFCILETLLLGFPARIALGDGNKDDRKHGDHKSDGRNSAAHAVEIKKVKQGTEGLRAGTIKKQGRAELAHKDRHENDPARHDARAHHRNQNTPERRQKTGAARNGGFFQLLVDLDDRAADGSHAIGQKTSYVGD